MSECALGRCISRLGVLVLMTAVLGCSSISNLNKTTEVAPGLASRRIPTRMQPMIHLMPVPPVVRWAAVSVLISSGARTVRAPRVIPRTLTLSMQNTWSGNVGRSLRLTRPGKAEEAAKSS